MTNPPCPLDEGDRVDHKIFGFGTVVSAPVAVVGPDISGPGGVRDAGWRVRVQWDNPEKADGDYLHSALRKISSPDARPFSYWDKQWQPLLQAWLTARREVEHLSGSFRPLPDAPKLAQAIRSEQEAHDAMKRFLDEEEAGEHS